MGLRSMTMQSLGCQLRAAQERAAQQLDGLKQTADKAVDAKPEFKWSGTHSYEPSHIPEEDTIAIFYKTIITLGRRIACPCAPDNIRTLNRLYKMVFGKDMPEEATRIHKDPEVMKNMLEPYLIQTAIKAGKILHDDAEKETVDKINKLVSRVFITHPQLFC
jgi:hypothetical protein